MYICICNRVTDGEIRRAMDQRGPCTLRDLRRELGVCSQCGKCAPEVRRLLREYSQTSQLSAADLVTAG
ncbi:(2Fe-2S)-binding protein [Candidatus Methylocalor cossyra]|uniref:(2Fe-2S)-binding protein n=1 Tax=Candidatus Methylocalor cossyra TaxID=3108543 RepID=UPI003D6CD0D5